MHSQVSGAAQWQRAQTLPWKCLCLAEAHQPPPLMEPLHTRRTANTTQGYSEMLTNVGNPGFCSPANLKPSLTERALCQLSNEKALSRL